jgi:hypothetical protein
VITIVSGFQRCGSSLMLQMLAAGGMRVFHDPGMGYPAFETMLQIHRADDPSWLMPLDGHALKWLEPQRAMPPSLPHDLRIVWMARDHREQAKSAVKFMTQVGGLVVPVRQTVRQFEASYRTDTGKALKAWQRRGAVRFITFEDVLSRPAWVAKEVAAFLGVSLDVDAMVRQVRPRKPGCLPGFLELELIRAREMATA